VTNDYILTPHADVHDLPAQALRLASAAFAGYAGVTLPTPGKVNWYLARPRMRRDLSMGALTTSGELVSSVYITLEGVRLAGELAPVALVDTVMTDPAHRQRSLARRALLAALEASRAAGADAALLFTVPDSMPYRLYESLGFRVAAQIRVLAVGTQWAAGGQRLAEGQQAGCEGASNLSSVRLAAPDDVAALTAFWNHAFGAHDGYVPLDAPLWRWRREQRPPVLPSETWLAPASGPLGAAVNHCEATVMGAVTRGAVTRGAATRGAATRTIVLTDLAWLPGEAGLAHARALLASLPPEAEARALAPESDVALCGLLAAMGFAEGGREAAMCKPLTPRGERLLSDLRAPWYALPESVIGV
jgi:GNAT superfamily N-acetyltransferase